MIVTEEEAKGLWCPMARAVTGIDNGATTNRDFTSMNGSHACNCLASKCMMWRWAEPDQTPVHHPSTGAIIAWQPNEERKGYCGIGGNL